jgi:hypothetical protein
MEKAHRNLVRWAIDQGYTVEVWGEDEYQDYKGTDFDEAVENVEGCDGGTIYLNNADGENVAWFSYVFDWDQNPDEIINDWGINEVSGAWDKQYNTLGGCYGVS